ncbi:unnamed protein product [Urochloa humidicola]
MPGCTGWRRPAGLPGSRRGGSPSPIPGDFIPSHPSPARGGRAVTVRWEDAAARAHAQGVEGCRPHA